MKPKLGLEYEHYSTTTLPDNMLIEGEQHRPPTLLVECVVCRHGLQQENNRETCQEMNHSYSEIIYSDAQIGRHLNYFVTQASMCCKLLQLFKKIKKKSE